MAVYIYTAIDPARNKSIEGRIEAQNLREAKEILRNQGHIPTSINEDQQSATVEGMLHKIPIVGDLLTPGVSMKDINIMTQQLHTLLNAGIPLIEGLFMLEQQSQSGTLKGILKKVRTDVIAGDSFSAALTKYPKQFSSLYVSMVKAGEISGELELV